MFCVGGAVPAAPASVNGTSAEPRTSAIALTPDHLRIPDLLMLLLCRRPGLALSVGRSREGERVGEVPGHGDLTAGGEDLTGAAQPVLADRGHGAAIGEFHGVASDHAQIGHVNDAAA